MTGDTTQDEEVGQNVDPIDGLELAGDTDRQAFMGELVEHVEHPIFASVMGAVLDEVVGPDMIVLLRPQPDARTVGRELKSSRAAPNGIKGLVANSQNQNRPKFAIWAHNRAHR